MQSMDFFLYSSFCVKSSASVCHGPACPPARVGKLPVLPADRPCGSHGDLPVTLSASLSKTVCPPITPFVNKGRLVSSTLTHKQCYCSHSVALTRIFSLSLLSKHLGILESRPITNF